MVKGTEWESATPREKVQVQTITDESGQPLQPNLTSPVLLLGDSHTLVFSEPESFHCDGVGLFDQLSYQLGGPIDLEGSAGGGLVTARLNLYRKVVANPTYWQGKRAVVWVFSAREITQSTFRKGFISVPIEKKQ